MSATLVLDAGVAVKWFLPEAADPLSENAWELLEKYRKGKVGFVVPDLFWTEFASVIRKAVEGGRCSKGSAEEIIGLMAGRKLPTLATRPLVERAMELAVTFDRTVPECVYVVLALTTKGQMVTADERLANALAAYLPVKWLGSL